MRVLVRALMMAVLLTPGAASARTLVVDLDGHASAASCADSVPTPYRAIQAAITAAATGDIIKVCPGVYDEQLVIGTSVALRGDNGVVVRPSSMAFNTTSPSSGLPLIALILVQNALNVTIERFVVDGSAAVEHTVSSCPSPGDRLFGIFCRNAFGQVKDSAIMNLTFRFGATPQTCADGAGIRGQSGTGSTSTVFILGNSIHDDERNGVTAIGAGTKVQVANNVITGLGTAATRVQNGVQISNDATGSVVANVIAEHVSSACVSPDSCPAPSVDIIVVGGSGVRIASNTLGRSQTGVELDDTTGARVTGNTISRTLVFDGIAVFADGALISHNTITDSDESGMYVEGNNNVITANRIQDAPIGIWLADGTGNQTTGNTFLNTPEMVR